MKRIKRLAKLLMLDAAVRLVQQASEDLGSFVLVHDHERKTTTITTGLTSRDAELLQDAARRRAELHQPANVHPLFV